MKERLVLSKVLCIWAERRVMGGRKLYEKLYPFFSTKGLILHVYAKIAAALIA